MIGLGGVAVVHFASCLSVVFLVFRVDSDLTGISFGTFSDHFDQCMSCVMVRKGNDWICVSLIHFGLFRTTALYQFRSGITPCMFQFGPCYRFLIDCCV